MPTRRDGPIAALRRNAALKLADNCDNVGRLVPPHAARWEAAQTPADKLLLSERMLDEAIKWQAQRVASANAALFWWMPLPPEARIACQGGIPLAAAGRRRQ